MFNVQLYDFGLKKQIMTMSLFSELICRKKCWYLKSSRVVSKCQSKVFGLIVISLKYIMQIRNLKRIF